MAFPMQRFHQTLGSPDAVRPSGSSPPVHLYHRLYPDLRGRSRYICLVVRREADDSVTLTAHLARSIKGG